MWRARREAIALAARCAHLARERIVVVLVTRAMELREEEREAPTRAPDDGRDGRRFAHRVAV